MLYIFTDDVPANNTIWILGDSLLTNAAGHYNTFKRKKGDSKFTESQALYMENMYAIRLVSPGICTTSQAKNVPSLILSSLVDTLNLKAKVPHTLVLLINDPKFWNHTDLLTYQMERIIGRFLKEIRRIVEDRNLSLPPRAVNWDYPRIFITRALPMPNNMLKPYPKGFKTNRKLYNKLLQRGGGLHNYTTISLAEFSSDNLNNFFAQDGSITQAGYKYLWTAISDAIHKADNQDRINMNKAKAKQLAAQISLTNSDLKPTNHVDDQDADELSDSEQIGKVDHQTRKPVKRSLTDEFDSSIQKRITSTAESPGSHISEYFTRHGPTQPMACCQLHHHNQPAGRRQHHKWHGNHKSRNNHNWRQQKHW